LATQKLSQYFFFYQPETFKIFHFFTTLSSNSKEVLDLKRGG
jgi:hypothetical protein